MKRHISEKSLQLDALDGMRGFAALIVILSHTSNSSMFFFPNLNAYGTGKSGVFLFFLLSSFLLSRALIKKGKSAFSFAAMSLYAERRFFRIYPLYITYLLLALISTFLLSTLFGLENKGIPFSLDTLEFLKHLTLLEGKGVTWSITVEFKFYFLLPIIILCCFYIRKNLGLLSEIIFLVILIVISQMISPQEESLRNDSRLLPYICIFLFGTLLAVIQCEIESGRIKKKVIKPFLYAGYLSAAVLVLMSPSVFSIFQGETSKDIFHRYFIEYSILWGIILLSVINFDSILATFFRMKWLCFYGSISFSIYLFHPIFINVAGKLAISGYLAAWFVLFLSTITSFICFRILELPASKLTLNIRNRSMA